ncbi:MAG TPA: sigma-70 family RNA polymerase sigma factor [Polyangiaceae bacterium]|nr:sigma-70 family RNA polymerase sigma factor [Polyangiaceae bacterium]
MAQPPASFAQAREQFLGMVEELRPELHRYCARLTGSTIEGEDIVQDALAKAFYALTLQADVPPLRPWLFRIAHNQAMDFLRSHGRRFTEVRDDLDDAAVAEARPDPVDVRAALARFLALPLPQRSAVILKDVLGHSLEETAETMDTTILAVKSALVRGRARLAETPVESEAPGQPKTAPTNAGRTAERADLDRYATLFNARDWDGVRALVADDCRLDLVSKSQRRGKEVGTYFARYETQAVDLRVVRLEGQLALAAYPRGATRAAYFILLGWESGRVTSIRDFRYVAYIAAEAVFAGD